MSESVQKITQITRLFHLQIGNPAELEFKVVFWKMLVKKSSMIPQAAEFVEKCKKMLHKSVKNNKFSIYIKIEESLKF